WGDPHACGYRYRQPVSPPRRQAGYPSLRQLVEGLTLFNHAQLMAGALFDSFHTALEFQHFGFEDAIALQQALVLTLLLGNLLLQRTILRQAVVSHPQAILQVGKTPAQRETLPERHLRPV